MRTGVVYDEKESEDQSRVNTMHADTPASASATSVNSSSSKVMRNRRVVVRPTPKSPVDFEQTLKIRRRIDPVVDTFDPEDPVIKQHILQLIVQYLEDQQMFASMLTLQDEARAKFQHHYRAKQKFLKIQQAIISGDWDEVERLFDKPYFKKHANLHYAVYKQKYLELIDRQETSKALVFMTKYLKPFEVIASRSSPREFADLCYLLSCRSVQDAPSFKDWEDVQSSREQLAEKFDNLPALEGFFEKDSDKSTELEPGRLVNLLQQACAYQIEFSDFDPRLRGKVNTLLADYQSHAVPNAVKSVFNGHQSNVKCLSFVGNEGTRIISGGGDFELRLWDTFTAETLAVLRGHTSRIWDVSASKSGRFVASASGDSTIKLWNVSRVSTDFGNRVSSLTGHEGDIYSLQIHPTDNHIISGGYDRHVRLFDIESEKLLLTMSGHESSISSVIFNPLSNLAISGSKDCTIRFWDISSGVCIKSFESHLGEVTSLEISSSGSKLLTSSKDNANRLWDIRASKPIQRYKGHQNTFKNFIRCSFGPGEAVVVGGSEDGRLCIWDLENAELLSRLEGHTSIAYMAQWNADQRLLASCSEDATVRTWAYDPSATSTFIQVSPPNDF